MAILARQAPLGLQVPPVPQVLLVPPVLQVLPAQ